MRYNELIENDDNDMFGSSERVDRDLRRATFNANIPEMIRRVQQGLLANADRLARAMANEFFREANFLEKDEVYELAREVFTHEAPQHLHQAFAILSEDPSIIEDEDRMSDVLMTNNIFTDIRNDCELWIYTSEMLEEFAEGDENQGDLEYHLAMEIEGTVGNLMISLIQQAFADVRALGENSKPGVAEGRENVEHFNGLDFSIEIEKDDEYVDDDDTDNQTIYVKAFANGRELGHVLFTIDYDGQGIILKPQDLEVDERFQGQGIAATMYDYVKSKGYRIRRSGQQTDAGAGFWNKHRPEQNVWEQGVAEDTDDELFSKRRDRPVNRFTIYVNNKALRTMIDLEQAVGAAEDLINQETRRVNVQVINAFDGEILWSGGTDRMGKWHGAYAAYLEEADDDDDLFSDRPNGKVIAQDLELWLRRRQSGSRRPLSSYSADAIMEIVAAFNKSFAAGVQAWDVAPIIADLKYDIREYIGSSQHIDLADHVQELNEAPLADYEPMGNFEKPGPFRGADKKLIPHPTNKLKTAKFFEQTPYDFRLFFSNIPGTGRYSEYGPMRPEVVQEIFKDTAEQILAGHENAITVVFVGNKGDSKVMLTPWMMAHRIGHAVQAGTKLAGGRGAWREAENHFFRGINQLLKDFYNKSSTNRYDSDANWAMSQEYSALFNAIGTQRSSRAGQIKRPYEFLYELFAQYLGTGKIELNPLPKQQAYGRKVFGRSSQSMRMTPGAEEESKYTTEVLARDMELMFNDVLSELVGKVLVM